MFLCCTHCTQQHNPRQHPSILGTWPQDAVLLGVSFQSWPWGEVPNEWFCCRVRRQKIFPVPSCSISQKTSQEHSAWPETKTKHKRASKQVRASSGFQFKSKNTQSNCMQSFFLAVHLSAHKTAISLPRPQMNASMGNSEQGLRLDLRSATERCASKKKAK